MERVEQDAWALGDFLGKFKENLRAGSRPENGCVLCGTTTALLHPVQNAWACSKCHDPAGRAAG